MNQPFYYEPLPQAQPQPVNPSTQMRVVHRRPTYTAGMRVKVNNHPATILRVITHVETYDPFQDQSHRVPLLNPVYELEVDRNVQYRKWHDRQVYLPPNTNTLKLFADEFCQIVPNEAQKRTA